MQKKFKKKVGSKKEKRNYKNLCNDVTGGCKLIVIEPANMFYVKSSFVLFFIAFYIELSVFEGESQLNFPLDACTPPPISLLETELFVLISFFIFAVARGVLKPLRRQHNSKLSRLQARSQSLNTFRHETNFPIQRLSKRLRPVALHV